MKVFFRDAFRKDLKKTRDKGLARQIQKLIMRLESADAITAIPHLKKLAGTGNFYRIRLGEYRVGCVISGSSVDLVRVLHRKEIYRFFP